MYRVANATFVKTLLVTNRKIIITIIVKLTFW
jgi:hypothetical protein